MCLAFAIGMCGSFPGSRGGLLLVMFLAALSAALVGNRSKSKHGRFILPSPKIKMARKIALQGERTFYSGHPVRGAPFNALAYSG